MTDNFLVPQWGGMVIYNSQELLLEPGEKQDSTSDGGPLALRVDMNRLMPIFVEQLKMLLGVPDMVRKWWKRVVIVSYFLVCQWQPVFQEGMEKRFRHSPSKHGVLDWVS